MHLEFQGRELWGLDCETHITQPGLAAPPVVAVSTSERAANTERVYDRHEGLNVARALFERAAAGEVLIGGQTIDYDMGVIAAALPELLHEIFAAVERGAVISADLIEKLHRIATGTDDDHSQKNDLVSLEKRYLGEDRTQEKENGWRLRYHELDGVPLSQWPDDAIQYPRRDARGVLEVLLRQLGITGAREHEWIDVPDEEGATPNATHTRCKLCDLVLGFGSAGECPNGKPRVALNLQCVAQEMRMCLVLRLASVWGMRTDPIMVWRVVGQIRERHEESRRKFFEAGIVRVRPCNKKDGVYERGDDITAETLEQFEAVVPDGRPWTAERLDDLKKCRKAREKNPDRPLRYAEDKGWLKELVSAAYKGDPPLTDGGESGKQQVSTSRDTLEESGELLLEEYGEAGANEKLFSTYVDVLEQGTVVPINFGFNSTLSTQRVSLFEPNLSQLPRKGAIRECFSPRGYVEVEE